MDSQAVQNDKIKYTVVVIYDISDNRRRLKFAKTLKAYGYRVQRSAFECIIDNSKYRKLIRDIEKQAKKEDLIRVYKLHSNTEMLTWGDIGLLEDEDFLFF